MLLKCIADNVFKNCLAKIFRMFAGLGRLLENDERLGIDLKFEVVCITPDNGILSCHPYVSALLDGVAAQPGVRVMLCVLTLQQA